MQKAGHAGVFGMPVFHAPTIPLWQAGQLGPAFGARQGPPTFPQAGGMGGCCPGRPGFGQAVEHIEMAPMEINVKRPLSPAQEYNAKACAKYGWRGSIAIQSVAPWLVWAPGAGEPDCASAVLVTAAQRYQKAAGLLADGKIGPRTTAALQGQPLPPFDQAQVRGGGEGDSTAPQPPPPPPLPGEGTPWALVIGAGLLVAGGLWLAFRRG